MSHQTSNAFRTKVRLKRRAVAFLLCFQIKSSSKYVDINYSGRSIRWNLHGIGFYITSYHLYMQIQFYNKSEPNIQYNRNMTKFTNQLLVKPDSTTLSLMKWCLLWVWGFWRPLTIYHENWECELFLRVSHLMLHIIILWVVAAFVSFAKVPFLKNE